MHVGNSLSSYLYSICNIVNNIPDIFGQASATNTLKKNKKNGRRCKENKIGTNASEINGLLCPLKAKYIKSVLRQFTVVRNGSREIIWFFLQKLILVFVFCCYCCSLQFVVLCHDKAKLKTDDFDALKRFTQDLNPETFFI